MSFAALALLIVLLVVACSGVPVEPTPTLIPRDVVPIKPTYEVQVGAITHQTQFIGRIMPVMEAALFFNAAGHIRTLLVAEGDFVSAGQLLADLDIIDDLNRRQALNAIAIQRAELRLERARLQLALTLTRAAPDTREIEVAIQQVDVDLAQIALDELRLQLADEKASLEDAQIMAPFDGQILSINIGPGESVNAFDSVIVMADMTQLEAGANLQRSRVDELEVGMVAALHHASRPGETVGGTIRRLPYRSADDDIAEGDTTVRVVLDASPEASSFELGDRVEITVTLEQKADVLWLPPQAIRAFGGRQFVVVQEGDAQRRVDVVLGTITSDRVEIVEGLVVGQIVVGP